MRNKKIINVYKQVREAVDIKSGSHHFEQIERIVGNDRTRPPDGNDGSIPKADPVFDDKFGHSIKIKTYPYEQA